MVCVILELGGLLYFNKLKEFNRLIILKGSLDHQSSLLESQIIQNGTIASLQLQLEHQSCGRAFFWGAKSHIWAA